MKKLLVILVALLALLVVAFFVLTSSGFLKSMVLPKVGAALNAKVDAESVSLSPFSSVEIRKLTVVPNGAEPLASVELARVRYSLFAILGGRIEVEEILVGSPSLTLVQKADGTSNLDPIMKKLGEGASAPAPAKGSAPGKPVQLDLRSFKIENASLSYRASAKDGSGMSADVTGLNLTARDLKNGGKGRIEIGSGLKFEQRTAAPTVTTSGVQGTIKGGFDLGLSPELAPGAVGGKLEAQLQQATGAFKEFQGFATVVSADLVPGELKRLAVEFARQGTAMGSVTAAGPLDLAKKEAKLQVDVSAIDRNVLNLAGAAMGLDFATTRFDSANRIELTAGGQKVSITGSVTGSRVSVKKGEMVMPPVDLKDSYDVAVDLTAQSATVKAFALSGTQGGREILQGALSQPLQVSWAPNAGALPDASVQLKISDFRLADWSALAGTPLQGTLNAQAEFGVKGGGKDLGFRVAAGLAGMSGTFGSNVVKNLGFDAAVQGGVASFAEAAKRRLTVAAEVKELTGEAAVVKFNGYAMALTSDIGLPEGEVVIHDLQVRLRQRTQEGGSVGVKGRWNTVKGAGEIAVVAKDLNEAALKPFLQAALGDKELRSVKIAAELSTKYDPAADFAVKGSAELKDLVVRDPSGTVPESPLAAGLSLDLGGTATRIAVRQGELRLSPTARAKNIATLTGDLDFGKTNALKGGFKLTSESLDVTPFYDLFAGGAETASTSTSTPPPANPVPPAGGPQREPDPVKLPIELFTFDATVGKFFLREVAAENFVMGLKIAGSRIEVQPLQLALNGAPIKADLKLDLGVPGYIYDLNAQADRIPVKPFANSFVPMLKDRIEGAFQATAQVKGAGITGVSLQKNLAGALGLSVTNANLRLNDPNQKKGLLTLLTSLLAKTLNIRELQDRPIMDIVATAKMGGGKIDLTEARARSSSLEVGTSGSLPIAADLMQTPVNLPVNVSLNRELAQKARLMPANTPTNQAYVAIPAIASLKGTLGAPTPDIDKVAAGLLLARGLAGLAGGQTGNAVSGVADLIGGVAKGETNAVGNLIQGVGNLFGGKKQEASPAATPATAASTNAPAKAAPASSTTTTTNAAPATNALNKAVGGLLKGLLGNDNKKP